MTFLGSFMTNLIAGLAQIGRSGAKVEYKSFTCEVHSNAKTPVLWRELSFFSLASYRLLCNPIGLVVILIK